MAKIELENLSEILKEQIKNFEQKIQSDNVGRVISIADGIAFVSGLDKVMYGELVVLNNDIFGMVLDLEQDIVGVVIFGETNKIKENDPVKRTNKVIAVPYGDQVLGRVLDALGNPIDNLESIDFSQKIEIFKIAPGVMAREEVNQPLETGILAIDSMIPIGKGQRELIIGDRQTGKTAIAIDTIINQKDKNVFCIYVAIGQKNSNINQIIQKLKQHNALEYTTIINASASEMATMQYIAPYTGITIAEQWMKNGKDVLIVYDDLSKHAIAYRTLSLLLRRPPGREAYPGDIFYIHSQLLERSARVNKKYGGGSITAFPIIETFSNDISAYIPTNVISITDGQIFLLSSLFNSGQRPAINVGFSVSRVGSNAQTKIIKNASASLKLELAQYFEMLDFAQFGSDLDDTTKNILNHGSKIMAIMKQEQYKPLNHDQQTFLLLAIKNKLIKDIPLEQINYFKDLLLLEVETNKQFLKIKKEFLKQQKITPELEDLVCKLIQEMINTKITKVENPNG